MRSCGNNTENIRSRNSVDAARSVSLICLVSWLVEWLVHLWVGWFLVLVSLRPGLLWQRLALNSYFDKNNLELLIPCLLGA